MAMLPKMLEDDRRRAGWSVGQAAWRLGVSVREYREIEAGVGEVWTKGGEFTPSHGEGSITSTEAGCLSRSCDGLQVPGAERVRSL